jgi:uncharacterized protein (TIGR02118 family)
MMIKLTVFYPDGEGKRFDMDYYMNKHMPLSVELQGAAVKAVSVDVGINGGPETKPPYVAVCHFLYDSYQDFEAAFMPHAKVLMDDIANYTNIETVIQFSEVKTFL